MPRRDWPNRFDVPLPLGIEGARRGIEQVERVTTLRDLITDAGSVHDSEKFAVHTLTSDWRSGRRERGPVIGRVVDQHVARGPRTRQRHRRASTEVVTLRKRCATSECLAQEQQPFGQRPAEVSDSSEEVGGRRFDNGDGLRQGQRGRRQQSRHGGCELLEETSCDSREDQDGDTNNDEPGDCSNDLYEDSRAMNINGRVP